MKQNRCKKQDYGRNKNEKQKKIKKTSHENDKTKKKQFSNTNINWVRGKYSVLEDILKGSKDLLFGEKAGKQIGE